MDPTSFFHQIDTDRSGRLSARELQSVLMSSNGRKFDEAVCQLMIDLFAGPTFGHPPGPPPPPLLTPGPTEITLPQFQSLYTYINQWIGTFQKFDSNNSGFIDQSELGAALSTMGYRFGPDWLAWAVGRFQTPDSNHQLPVDRFIQLCILLHKYTDKFREKDVGQTGSVTLTYEEFLRVVL